MIFWRLHKIPPARLFLLVIVLLTFLCLDLANLKVPSVVNITQVEDLKAETFASEQQVKGASEKGKQQEKKVQSVYLGMWTQGFWDDSAKTLHPEKLAQVEKKIEKKVAIAHYYRGWDALDSPALLSELQAISTYGWRPMISVNPYFFDRCQAKGMTLYKAIANGNCDEFLSGAGKNLKQFGKPLFLRFAWEMNIGSMEWSVIKTGDKPPDFVAAWQKLKNVISAQGATNVLFVFSPNTEGVGSVSYSQIYPGDKFVDWVALDGYNWGTTQPWSKWLSFSQVFKSSYSSLSKIAPGKPMMIAEVNTTDKGGDKASWYTDMLKVQIPANFPRVRAIVFYNEDRTSKENVNWLIDITQGSLDAFKSAIAGPSLISSL